MASKVEYRSLQQIAADKLTIRMDELIKDVENFCSMTALDKDAVEKLKKVRNRIVKYRHPADGV